MRVVFSGIVAAAVVTSVTATAVAAQNRFPGPIIAAFYNEEMSVPKGWRLSYKGREAGVEVFIMDRDLDAAPQTSWIDPRGQMQRLMCGDAGLRDMLRDSGGVRADVRDKKGGKAQPIVAGIVLRTC